MLYAVSMLHIPYLRCSGTVSFFDREPADAAPFVYAPGLSHPGLKAVLQHFRCAGAFDLGDHLTAAIDAGIELRQRDHTALVPKRCRDFPAGLPDKVIDVPGAGQKLALAD